VRHSLDKHHIHADDILELTNLYEKIQYDENEFYQLKNNTNTNIDTTYSDSYTQNLHVDDDEKPVLHFNPNVANITHGSFEELSHININEANNINTENNNYQEYAQEFLSNIKNVAQTLWKQITGLTNINININITNITVANISNISNASNSLTEEKILNDNNSNITNIEDISNTSLPLSLSISNKDEILNHNDDTTSNIPNLKAKIK
jgi:hypothetical protein